MHNQRPARTHRTWLVVLTGWLPALLAGPTSSSGVPPDNIEVSIGWDAPQPGIVGYNVYVRPENGQYGAPATFVTGTTGTIGNLSFGTIYYFSVTSVDAFGLESAKSAELAWSYGDLDADRMQDDWEIWYFGRSSGPGCGAHDDWDRDGRFNVEEYVAGSNPAQARDPSPLSIAVVNGQCQVTLHAAAAAGPGYDGYQRVFDLEWASGPNASWQKVPGRTGIVGASQPVTYRPGSTSVRGSYRAMIRLLPAVQ